MNRNVKKAILLIGVIGLASIGGVAAYLTDYDKVANAFTVGKVEIELAEPDWKPEEQTKIEPGRVIPKDPQIKNTGINAAFVYLEVGVPMADVVTVNQDGIRQEQKLQELFSFHAGEEWENLSKKTIGDKMIYVYTYKEILDPEKITQPLFENVKFLNIIEGQLDMQTLDIPVRAYAIQAAHTGEDAGTVQDQARAAYEKYVNQNRDQEGRVTE